MEDAEGVFIAAHLDAGVTPFASDVGEERLGDVLVDEHGVEGVADAVFTGLGVVDDTDRLLDVGSAVHIGMTDAGSTSQHRHGRVGGDVLDEFRAASRHDEVDGVAHAEELAEKRAVGVLDELDSVRRSSCRRYRLADDARAYAP